MIFVSGHPPYPPSPPNSSSSSSSSSSQPPNILVALMQNPILVSASHSFKLQDSGFAMPQNTKFVYVFQREYATVDPAFVHFIGTDEATTCVCLVIRNRKTGMISVAHMDSPKVVDFGLTQMLSLLIHPHSENANFDVHLVGGFEDVSPNHANNRSTNSKWCAKPDGHSFPLCAKIVETLQKRQENFHIQTLFVLGHNTERDSQGNACPIVKGLLVETSTGSVMPASFDKTSRCPDEIVRRLRVSAAHEDSNWKGKLLDTYDTRTDRFIIAPCCWTVHLVRSVSSLQNLSDTEILLNCSTSPSAEGSDFVENERRFWDYLIKHPDWGETFPMSKPRVFERTAEGAWKQADYDHHRKDGSRLVDNRNPVVGSSELRSPEVL
ncbi:hypothetical protein SLA2020_323270 [Shorea laevis]